MSEQIAHINELLENRDSTSSRIIAIASGKGGVGKSNIALNLGIALSRLRKKVIVVDGDTNLANLDVLCGLTPQANLLSYVLGDASIAEILVHHNSGIDILPNSSGGHIWRDIDDTLKIKFYQLLFHLRQYYDIILLDTAPGLSPLTIDLICKADEAIMVTTTEPPAISDAYAMIKIVNSVKKDMNINLMLNMVFSLAEVADVYQRFSLVLKHFLGVNIGIVGYISFDEHVRMAVKKQQPFLVAFPDSAAARDIQQTASTVLAREVFITELVPFY